MPTRPPAQPGDSLAVVDTPALVIDLDAMERNMDAMARWAKTAGPNGAGVRLRPHAKTHKSPVVARMQMARGAVGVCCQKTAEAEILADGGVDDILITNQVVGAKKLERLAALARRVRLGVCVDDTRNVGELATAAQSYGATIDVLVEVDVGGARCGVQPGAPAARLAEAVARARGLSFKGIQAYYGGAQHFRTPDARRLAIEKATAAAEQSIKAIETAGLACDTVGGAGTGTFANEASTGIWNELQPGSYVFMDVDYAKNEPDESNAVPRFEHSFFVWTTVMSRRAGEWAVVDAGHKAAAVDSGPPQPFARPGLRYDKPSDDHGMLFAEEGVRLPSLGEKLALTPGHCDPTANLHDWYVGVRGLGRQVGALSMRPDHPQEGAEGAFVEAVWPVAARGAGF